MSNATKFIAFASGFAACGAFSCALNGSPFIAAGLAVLAVIDGLLALRPEIMPV